MPISLALESESESERRISHSSGDRSRPSVSSGGRATLEGVYPYKPIQKCSAGMARCLIRTSTSAVSDVSFTIMMFFRHAP